MTTVRTPIGPTTSPSSRRPALAAAHRGALVPLGGRAGRVRVIASSAMYLGDTPETMFVVRPAVSVCPRTMTPSSVVLDGSLPALRPDQRFQISRGILSVGAVAIDLLGAAMWELPATRTVGDDAVANAARRLASFVDPRIDKSRAHLGARLESFVGALSASNSAAIGSAVESLIGFGPGLTPSGDDVVVGALCAYARLNQRAAFPAVFLAHHTHRLLERTSLVSAHILWMAIEGQHAEPAATVVDDAVGGDDAVGFTRSLATLLNTGATSGADLFVGIAAAFEAMARSRPLR